jgi:hypothetical protein
MSKSKDFDLIFTREINLRELTQSRICLQGKLRKEYYILYIKQIRIAKYCIFNNLGKLWDLFYYPF